MLEIYPAYRESQPWTNSMDRRELLGILGAGTAGIFVLGGDAARESVGSARVFS